MPGLAAIPKYGRPEKFFECKISQAQKDWKNKRNRERINNAALDQLMRLQGLEEVKREFLNIMNKVDIYKEQNVKLKQERFNIVFQGNPGTGKTTVARIYAKFLRSMGILDSDFVEETSGTKLAVQGPGGVQKTIEGILKNHSGGVLFVDEAYQLVASHTSSAGRGVLDIILTELERHIGKLVAIFVGYQKDMESFFEHNEGLRSRIPFKMQFSDFSDFELWGILRDNICAKYGGRLRVAGGMGGLFMRITIRRLSQGRGTKGFGNARAVENLLAKISDRQAKRLYDLKLRDIQSLDYFYFSRQDLIGPNPSFILKSRAWETLQKLIGIDAVKDSAQALFTMLETNYYRELQELKPMNISLNRIFLGNPGTGKTTVAKLYGQILADVGLLSDGEVVTKNPSDFIGECLGQSEQKTRQILASTIGKVLIIDEAYMFDSGINSHEPHGNGFKTEVIDTIVAEVQSVPGEDRCILLLGYEDKLRQMFQNVNRGLSRRFRMEDAFRFDDYNLPQLGQILQLKMDENDLSATEEALSVARDLLYRSQYRPDFCNASEAVTLLNMAQVNHQKRHQHLKPIDRPSHVVLQPEDFDRQHDRHINPVADFRSEMEGSVARDIIKKFEKYLAIAQFARSRGQDVRRMVPTRFLFKGPPGTGKSMAAKRMGSLFYKIGLIPAPAVIECSASELMGQYMGETRPKTKAKLDSALGRVLVVDDAPCLACGGYASEALKELEHRLGLPRYSESMVVILVGDNLGMEMLIRENPKLSSLFPEEITFRNLNHKDSMTLLERELVAKGINAPFFKETTGTTYLRLSKLIKLFSELPSWANASDVKFLANQLSDVVIGAMINNLPGHSTKTSQGQEIQSAEGEAKPLLGTLSPEQAEWCLKDILCNRRIRSTIYHVETGERGPRGGTIKNGAELARTPTAKSSHDEDRPEDESQEEDRPKIIWKAAPEISISNEEPKTIPPRKLMVRPPAQKGRVRSNVATKAPETKQKENDEVEAIEEYEESRRSTNEREDEKAHEKLRKLGKCVQGFEWRRAPGGYRCAGGSHFVSDVELRASGT